MTEKTKKLREAVELLSNLTETEWVLIDKIINENKEKVISIDKESQKEILDLFRDLGVPAHIEGYVYLRTAINYVIGNPNKKISITKDIYPYISEEFKSKPENVERCIRTAIIKAWEQGNISLHRKIFGYSRFESKKRPTNFNAIKSLAEYVRRYIF